MYFHLHDIFNAGLLLIMEYFDSKEILRHILMLRTIANKC